MPIIDNQNDFTKIRETLPVLCEAEPGYRQNNVYIGSLAEAVYYPPAYQDVPQMMERFLASVAIMGSEPKTIFPEIARQHIIFEQIHPFNDGNGRTGRMLLNQQLINCGLLPLYIKPDGKYRQAFRQYEKNGDLSLMVHVLCQGELQSIETIRFLIEERKKQQKQQKEEF